MNSTRQFVHNLLSNDTYDKQVITVFSNKDISAQELMDQVVTEGRKIQLINYSSENSETNRHLPSLCRLLIEKGYIIIFNISKQPDIDSLYSVLSRFKNIPYNPITDFKNVTGQIFIHVNTIAHEYLSDDFGKLVDYWGSHSANYI